MNRSGMEPAGWAQLAATTTRTSAEGLIPICRPWAPVGPRGASPIGRKAGRAPFRWASIFSIIVIDDESWRKLKTFQPTSGRPLIVSAGAQWKSDSDFYSDFAPSRFIPIGAGPRPAEQMAFH